MPKAWYQRCTCMAYSASSVSEVWPILLTLTEPSL